MANIGTNVRRECFYVNARNKKEAFSKVYDALERRVELQRKNTKLDDGFAHALYITPENVENFEIKELTSLDSLTNKDE
jgi:ribosomal protein L20A (L18A)